MEYSEINKRWPELKTKLKTEYPQLSDEDLTYELGRESELLLRIQEKLGKNKQEIDNWLSLMG